MPRYFFSTRIGDELIADTTGADLRDADHAWQVARATVLQILKVHSGDPPDQLLLMTAVLEVTDSDGEIVLEFPFSEALIDPGGPLAAH